MLSQSCDNNSHREFDATNSFSMAVIYSCPAHKQLLCSWEGYASDIKHHFEKEHCNLLSYTNFVDIDLEQLPQNKLLFLDGKIYLMQNSLNDKGLVIRLRYLGSKEVASKLRFNITVSVNQILYKYEPSRYFSCIVPRTGGWEINLQSLQTFHQDLKLIQCCVLIEENQRLERKFSDVSLKINNKFIEKNAIDETEANYLDAINRIENRLSFLKSNRNSDDFMDKISQLNFSILEEPFQEKEDFKSDYSESLPNIPEEINLTCSSCALDMLPPIYLCKKGHNVCSWCKASPCKICSEAVTIERNRDLENISRTHLHQCRYFSDGCNERLLYNEVRVHEAKCNFCKYKCSICPYLGRFDHFYNHLKVVHSSIKVVQTTRCSFPKNTNMFLVNKSIGIFYCQSETDDNCLIWRATFCGPKERQFFCEITFKGSKYKEAIFLKRRENVYEIKKSIDELKKMKAKEKYAALSVTTYE
ncbi:uncharacterized protein LOC661914 [Tribolium castaneum]|uniref:RING-type E3 ubiquitin transferase n=1 Tax=Tribolium castaneum TaxID=7070 RepID=D6WCR8_TRICA|nr:PREDICTED: uncharacterized protein LOC661914 [Tribolium castaneum]EEZ98854.2 hypothetical protein TcasGA2_TC004464 [Tribolium castaneum]|eukprot:XP_973137.2 PREDICTED: uncharacterized protein LOC661914 [Tribolium castaneum]